MSKFVIEYKTDDNAPWKMVEMFDEADATSYATDLLIDGFIVRLTEEPN
jgi:hypothetical protein